MKSVEIFYPSGKSAPNIGDIFFFVDANGSVKQSEVVSKVKREVRNVLLLGEFNMYEMSDRPGEFSHGKPLEGFIIGFSDNGQSKFSKLYANKGDLILDEAASIAMDIETAQRQISKLQENIREYNRRISILNQTPIR